MMKKFNTKFYFLSIIGLTCSTISFGTDLATGGLQNIGNAGPSAVILNLIYGAMNATMIQISQYVSTNNSCPPAKHFLKQTNGGFLLYNGGNCDVIAKFGSKAPGTLQGKVIRTVIQSSGTPSPSDFFQRATITNIDFDSNGTTPSILENPLSSCAWSPTMQSSSFGNVAAASASTVMNSSYSQITTCAASANPSTSGSASTSTNSATIG